MIKTFHSEKYGILTVKKQLNKGGYLEIRMYTEKNGDCAIEFKDGGNIAEEKSERAINMMTKEITEDLVEGLFTNKMH
ncbi:MAG: hypothetical protein ACR2MX_01655 [Cyclobacteriaceae bacterium]